MISYCEYASPLGTLLLVAGEHGLRGIYFDEHRHFKGKGSDWRRDPAQTCLARTAQQLDEFFAGARARHSMCRSICKARCFSRRCGKNCWQFRMAPPSVTGNTHSVSASRRPHALSVPQSVATRYRSWCLAIACLVRAAPSPVTPAAWNASRCALLAFEAELCKVA